jgi:transcriptional regulator with XRE-family HTH domain
MIQMAADTQRTVGEHIRLWRMRRRLSQLAFALDAEISQKHLSFLESGRAAPSREMVLHLSKHLEVPLRERNTMLLAAGFAPVFAERSLDDPELRAARSAVELVLKGHEPFPAMAVDRYWNLVAANAAISMFLAMVTDAELLKPPVNVLKLSLAPGGLAPNIENFSEWRNHVLDRLRRQADFSGDMRLKALFDDLQQLPAASESSHRDVSNYGDVLIPLRLRTPMGLLSFFSTVTVFGTPVDITLSELAIEALFPCDQATADTLLNASRGS